MTSFHALLEIASGGRERERETKGSRYKQTDGEILIEKQIDREIEEKRENEKKRKRWR